MTIEEQALDAVEKGRLLTTEELAYFWGIKPRTLDEMRRRGVVQTALPLKKCHRYSHDLIKGLPAVSENIEDAPVSLKTEDMKDFRGDKRPRKKGVNLCL